MEYLFSSEAWLSLLTLTAMELVLGIDNIVFLSLLVGGLPSSKQRMARRIGLGLALLMRVGLLLGLQWLMRLNEPWFFISDKGFSGKDLILLAGGIFLIAKSSHEIFLKLEVEGKEPNSPVFAKQALSWVIVQIVVVDLVFSLDSVITAVGMAQSIVIMVIATFVAILVMLFFSDAVGKFVHQHPSMKVLALSFLLLIGVMLLAEAMGQHISKGYIYFAMFFSLAVELINLRGRLSKRRVGEKQ